MPELPDIEIFSRSLNKIFTGKKLIRIKIVNGKKLQDKPAALTKALKGKKLKKIYRSGKELRFLFSDKTLLGIHLMLTGDIFLFEKKNERLSTIAELYFEGGRNLALTDRMKNAFLKLNPEDKAGVDALSKKLDYEYLKNAFQKNRIIKSVLTDQNIIRGIGNSYSDEILWEARISPYSIASAIPDKKIRELPAIIKKTLSDAIKSIYKKYKGKVNVEVKEFLKIHTKEKPMSPTGFPVIIEQKGLMKTYYTKEQRLYK